MYTENNVKDNSAVVTTDVHMGDFRHPFLDGKLPKFFLATQDLVTSFKIIGFGVISNEFGIF